MQAGRVLTCAVLSFQLPDMATLTCLFPSHVLEGFQL